LTDRVAGQERTRYVPVRWGAVGALAGAGTGVQSAETVRIDKAEVSGDAGFGITATMVIAALAGVRYSAHAQEKKGYPSWWLNVEAAAAGLIAATAITGHRL